MLCFCFSSDLKSDKQKGKNKMKNSTFKLFLNSDNDIVAKKIDSDLILNLNQNKYFKWLQKMKNTGMHQFLLTDQYQYKLLYLLLQSGFVIDKVAFVRNGEKKPEEYNYYSIQSLTDINSDKNKEYIRSLNSSYTFLLLFQIIIDNREKDVDSMHPLLFLIQQLTLVNKTGEIVDFLNLGSGIINVKNMSDNSFADLISDLNKVWQE